MISIEVDKRDVRLIQRAMDKIGNKVLSGAVSPAIRKAMRPLLKSMKSHAREIQDSGATLRSLRAKRKVYKKNNTVLAFVGQDWDYTEMENNKLIRPALYAHVLEAGSSRQQPNPIQFPAYQETKSLVSTIIAQELKRNIMKLANKHKVKIRQGLF